MKSPSLTRTRSTLSAPATTFLVVLGLAALAQAQTFTALYNFTGGSDGGNANAGVIQDRAGNLYGTTVAGGDLSCNAPYGCGVVYKLNTAGTETVLHDFAGHPLDGAYPKTPVTRDSIGNIYGTAVGGGSYDYGVVFKIDTAGNESVLYSFTGGSDGCYPYQGLVRDKAGNLYGTTWECGSSDWGTIFKVDSSGNFTILHSFAGYPSDGASPYLGHLMMDKSGNLYGVTTAGGKSIGCGLTGCGVLYKLSVSGTFTVLHSFAGRTSDGCYPVGSVVQDKVGNFYGTTNDCGTSSAGTIWKVSKKDNETILHNFYYGPSDGCWPWAGVARDSNGNLYGVSTGCPANRRGALYELSTTGTLTLLHSFDYAGSGPIGEVLRTTKGTLFGTTLDGGSGDCNGLGCGTVWSYVP
jgi:uncharacterized repeat protein (TIGR03803 family)